ncbi:MAG: hypothetical protein F4X97_01175 [Boseongicola sp. SB0662_bin_57]|nr:hypothetical protein [Boseongicola sp. SB0662_bin_57]
MEDLVDVLYDFLHGSGNSRTAFPFAAATVQSQDFWVGGSKHPAIIHLLSTMPARQRHRFYALSLAIVRQSMTWRRGRGEPLMPDEIVRLNEILLRLSIKVPELNEQDFLGTLHRPDTRRDDLASPGDFLPSDEVAK